MSLFFQIFLQEISFNETKEKIGKFFYLAEYMFTIKFMGFFLSSSAFIANAIYL